MSSTNNSSAVCCCACACAEQRELSSMCSDEHCAAGQFTLVSRFNVNCLMSRRTCAVGVPLADVRLDSSIARLVHSSRQRECGSVHFIYYSWCTLFFLCDFVAWWCCHVRPGALSAFLWRRGRRSHCYGIRWLATDFAMVCFVGECGE
jgi:hypothetical protein